MDGLTYLIVPLLQGFEWFDESLQRSLQARGWPQLTQPESSVMIHIILGINRPADIARSMGLTRQAVHMTSKQVIGKGMFELRGDPHDKRSKIVVLTTVGRAMRRDAQATIQYLTEQLAARIGRRYVDGLKAAFARDWGPPIICPPAYRRRKAAAARSAPGRLSGARPRAPGRRNGAAAAGR